MQEVVFDSQLLKDGHLACPEKYARPEAKFKVIVSFPEEAETDADREACAAADQGDDFLSKDEIAYYMNLA